MAGRLGVGFIGSGFMTRFHIRSWEAVRGRRHPRHLQPDPRQRRGRGRARAIAARRRREGVRLDRVDGRGRVDRLHLAVRPQLRARREHGTHRRRDQAGREARRRSRARSRWPERRGSGPRMVQLVEEAGRAARLSREPAVRAEPRARQADRLGARRAALAGHTWRARPKSTADRTCRGSGRAICRAAASSTT